MLLIVRLTGKGYNQKLDEQRASFMARGFEVKKEGEQEYP